MQSQLAWMFNSALFFDIIFPPQRIFLSGPVAFVSGSLLSVRNWYCFSCCALPPCWPWLWLSLSSTTTTSPSPTTPGRLCPSSSTAMRSTPTAPTDTGKYDTQHQYTCDEHQNDVPDKDFGRYLFGSIVTSPYVPTRFCCRSRTSIQHLVRCFKIFALSHPYGSFHKIILKRFISP